MKQRDTLEQQLLAREKSYWNAIMSKDCLLYTSDAADE